MEIRLGPGVPLAVQQCFPRARSVKAQVTSDHVECSQCGTAFPTCETTRESGGYCECGGELVLKLAVAARVSSLPETIEVTVVKETQ
jgi:hypothetical protein